MTGDYVRTDVGDPSASFGSPPPRRPARYRFGSDRIVDALADHFSYSELEVLIAQVGAKARRVRKKKGRKAARAIRELAGVLERASDKRAGVGACFFPRHVYASPNADAEPLEVELADGTRTTTIPPGASFTVPGHSTLFFNPTGQATYLAPGDSLTLPEAQVS